MPNVHHLELFYHVVRCKGISGAARQIPHRISQPTISAQILRLEDELGHTLFHRQPFQLTPAGEKLYQHIRPFFEDMDTVTESLGDEPSPELRIASSPMILRDHMPRLLRPVKRRFPDYRLKLREGQQSQVEQWFEAGEIDVAVTTLEGNPPPGCRLRRLLKLPLVVLTVPGSPITSVEQLLEQDRFTECLIGPPVDDAITRAFRRGLERMVRDWVPGIEVNSLELIESFVRNDYGIGISVDVPARSLAPGVRALPLPGFPTVTLGVLWRGVLQPPVRVLLEELVKSACALKQPR